MLCGLINSEKKDLLAFRLSLFIIVINLTSKIENFDKHGKVD